MKLDLEMIRGIGKPDILEIDGEQYHASNPTPQDMHRLKTYWDRYYPVNVYVETSREAQEIEDKVRSRDPMTIERIGQHDPIKALFTSAFFHPQEYPTQLHKITMIYIEVIEAKQMGVG